MLLCMTGKNLTVIAKVKAQPGKENDVLKLLLTLVEPSRKDAGCMNYDLHRSKENPALFLFHENWASRADLDRHLGKPDLQATIAQVVPLVAEPPEITTWEKVN
jgi:quinol monooxygenase YgiN